LWGQIGSLHIKSVTATGVLCGCGVEEKRVNKKMYFVRKGKWMMMERKRLHVASFSLSLFRKKNLVTDVQDNLHFHWLMFR
jgi:hypothetical protein